jgi:hypothetical protein
MLLTENPTRWPWHAWINFPLVPLTLSASRTPLVLWTTSPLVPLLFSWPSTAPANATIAAAATGALRLAAPARPQLWPPPPVLICALFPSVRAIYTRLRTRLTSALVPLPHPRAQQQRQAVQQPQPPQPQPQPQPQQQQQQQQGLGLQIRERFDLEIRAHIRVGHAVDPPAQAAAPAPAAGGGDAAAAVDFLEQEQQAPPEQQQQQPQQQPEPPQQQQQPQQQPQEQADAAPVNEEDFAAAAARTIRLTTASFGRLVGGALAMPTIARMMGAALLQLSHVLPLVRTIIAPREQMPSTPVPPVAAVGLLGLWNNLRRSRLFGGDGGGWRELQQQQIVLGKNGTALSTKVLSGLFLTTSQEWAMSDPVW